MNFKGNTKQACLSTIGSVLVASLLSFSCAPNKTAEQEYAARTESNSQIVGGVTADANYQNANGVVGLLMTTQNSLGMESQSICTGTLIDKRIILTAAHCIATPGLSNIIVFFDHDMQKATENRLRFALTGTVHEKYMTEVKDNDPNAAVANWNDIALLVLNEDAPADVKIAKIAAPGTALKKGNSLTLAGFGITNAVIRKEVKKNGKTVVQELAGVGDGILRKVDGILVAQTINNDHEIVLDQKKKGACHGDSGGPAFLKAADGSVIQVGVTSRGLEKLGNCNTQSVYTSVIAHNAWIKTGSADLLKQAVEIEKQMAEQAAAEQNKATPEVKPEVKPELPTIAGN